MISLNPRVLQILSALATIGVVVAQSPAWGQCGGQGWSGSTTCVSGYYCSYSNPFYSQCIPGTGPTTQQPTTTPPTSTTPQPTSTGSPGPAKFWFSFGDSYTSTGFNANGAKPSNSNPLGNPTFPGSTTTPGANWVGWVTSTYNNSLLYTYNYAVGGATIDGALVPPFSSNIPPVTTQVQTFLSTVGNKPSTTPWTSDNALFSVFIGINDIGSTYNQGGDRGAFSDKLLDSYFTQVKKLYDVGARNFLFVNVPPVDRSPLLLGQSAGNQQTEKNVIIGFNTKLLARVNAFKAANTGVTTFFWDSWTQFTTILNSPSTYGFRDATSVGTAAGYFWGDVYHPSSAAHKVFGEEVGRRVLGATVW